MPLPPRVAAIRCTKSTGEQRQQDFVEILYCNSPDLSPGHLASLQTR